MKISVAQLDINAGHPDQNVSKILNEIEKAKKDNVDVIVFSELCVSGYMLVYTNVINPRLKVLMRNFKLSDDISFRFSNRTWSEWPLTTEKFASWILNADQNEDVVPYVTAKCRRQYHTDNLLLKDRKRKTTK